MCLVRYLDMICSDHMCFEKRIHLCHAQFVFDAQVILETV